MHSNSLFVLERVFSVLYRVYQDNCQIYNKPPTAINDLSRPQLRLIIFYKWSCGTPAAKTVTKIGKVFGETTVTDRTVHNWLVRFQSEEKCFKDKDRCGRPTALNNDLLRDALKESPDVMFAFLLWDAKGMLYYELLPQGRTINATTYSFREVRRPQNGSIRLRRLAVRRVLKEGHRRTPRAMAHSCD
uniref:HTH_48 domain-containing protein n=1 Tax=Caenorhabditis japonica TaxID=281687 RepID=A0A8R1EPY1_CAEJA